MQLQRDTTNVLRSELLSSRALVGVEDLPATSHLEQQVRGLETSREARVQILQTLNNDLNARFPGRFEPSELLLEMARRRQVFYSDERS